MSAATGCSAILAALPSTEPSTVGDVNMDTSTLGEAFQTVRGTGPGTLAAVLVISMGTVAGLPASSALTREQLSTWDAGVKRIRSAC